MYDRTAVVLLTWALPKNLLRRRSNNSKKSFWAIRVLLRSIRFCGKSSSISIILPIRSPQSAKRYETIWTPEGSPLVVETEKLVGGMGQRLGKKFGLFCTYAMRYGDPSIANVVRNLHLEKGFQKSCWFR